MCGGQGGIRTHGTVAHTLVFKTSSLDHSDTCPVALKVDIRFFAIFQDKILITLEHIVYLIYIKRMFLVV